MKKILIIDDEPDIREIIRIFVTELGYSTEATNSGYIAVEKIRSNKEYWAVISDFLMPGLSGMELYDKVKELNSDLSGRFILLTGAMLDENVETKIAEKKIKILKKPFHFEGIRDLFSELEAHEE